MINDPYKILGVSPNATDEEIKQAYRRLAKQYHPDRNPGDAEAAKKMQQVNAAYEQIKNPDKRQTGSQGSYGGYGGYGGFGGYDPFGGAYQRQERRGTSYEQAAYQYILYGRYQEALNTLNAASERNARWYYLSALANDGVGNQVTAMEHIRRAVSMEPDNSQYQQLLWQMENGETGYRQRAGSFRGFHMRGNPCASLCLCYAAQLLCCRGGFFYC